MNKIKLPLNIDIIKQIEKYNPMVAGGYPLYILQKKQNFYSSGSHNDIDIFFETEEDYLGMRKVLFDNKYILDYETENSVAFRKKTEIRKAFDITKTLNLVKIFMPHKETIDRFDFVNSQCFSLFPFDEIQKPSNQNITTHLFFNKDEIKRAGITVKWIERVVKYHNQKRLNIPEETEEIVFNYLKNWRNFTDNDFKGHGYENNIKRREVFLKHLFEEILRIPSFHKRFMDAQKEVHIPLNEEDVTLSIPSYLMTFHYPKSILNRKYDNLPPEYQESEKFMRNYHPELFL